MMGDGIGVFAFWFAIGLVGLGCTFGPIGQALGRWIESRAQRGAAPPSPEVEGRLAELEQMTHRIAELEERLDFAERLLVRGRPGGGVDTPPEPANAAH